MARDTGRHTGRLLAALTLAAACAGGAIGVAAVGAEGTAAPPDATGGAPVQAAADQGSVFVPVVPDRILDTREGLGAAPAPIGPDQSIDVAVAGLAGVPAAATAVVLNVTVTANDAASFLTVWPTGEDQPLASNLNWVAGRTIPNAVTVKVGAGGKVSIYNNAGTTHVVADLAGYYVVGPTGPAGKDGVSGYVRATGRASLQGGGGQTDATAICPGGRSAIGGGASVVAAGSDGPVDASGFVRIVSSAPLGTNGWSATAAYLDGSGKDLVVNVICART